MRSAALAPLSGAKRLLGDRKLAGLAALPVLVTLISYSAVIAVAALTADDLVGVLWAKPAGAWLILWYLVVAVLFFAELLVLRGIFFTVTGIVAGPLYEKVAKRVLIDRGLGPVETGVLDGLKSTLWRFLLFVLPSIGFGLLGLIPGVGLVVFLPLSLTFSAFAFASEVLEAPLALLGLKAGERLRFVLTNKLACWALGVVLALALYVPFLVLLAMPAAIVGLSEQVEAA
jgi:CysZ protein